jgi:hypothetical protein
MLRGHRHRRADIEDAGAGFVAAACSGVPAPISKHIRMPSQRRAFLFVNYRDDTLAIVVLFLAGSPHPIRALPQMTKSSLATAGLKNEKAVPQAWVRHRPAPAAPRKLRGSVSAAPLPSGGVALPGDHPNAVRTQGDLSN